MSRKNKHRHHGRGTVIMMGAAKGSKPTRLPESIPDPYHALRYLRGCAERKRQVCMGEEA